MDLLTCLNNRDFAGALTVLRFTPGLSKDGADQWRAFLHFHAGRYEEALDIYTALAAAQAGTKSYDLHLAACLFRLRRYEEAQRHAEQGPDCQLRARLLLHCTAKLGGPNADLLELLAGVGSNVDDQVSLAALRFGRCDYRGAADVYGELLAAHPDLSALHVYLALCHYMLDDWASCQGHLEKYRRVHSDSVLAANMRACNEFRERDGEAARASLHSASAGAKHSALIQHNLVVFSDGLNGMQVLPPLVEVIPEARLNLVIFYLRRGDPLRALGLIKSLEPSTAFEYICKGVVYAMLAQQQDGSQSFAQEAQACFETVGTSESECDTIPGRQCMASSLLLKGEFGEALPFLESIGEFCAGDDAYNWNLGMARAAVGEYGPALEALSQVQRQDWVQEPGYVAWLARCHVMTGQPELAWQLYLQQQAAQGAAQAEVLQLIGHDCYRQRAFLWAARAFDALEFLGATQPPVAAGAGPSSAWEGKRGACVAVFREVTQGKQQPEVLREVLILLHNSSNPQAEYISRVISKWVRDAGAPVDVNV